MFEDLSWMHKPFKAFSFGKESKYVLQHVIYKKRIRRLHNYDNCCPFDFPWAGALYAIAFSVLDIGVIYLWPWV